MDVQPFVFSNAWKRALAFLIDSLVIVFCYMAVGILFALTGIESLVFGLPVIGLWWISGMLFFPWIYYAACESSKMQATIGKRAMGLCVTDLFGQRISFMRATGRYFGKFLSQITFGYLLILMTKKKQALHDKLASTVVIEALTTFSYYSSKSRKEAN